MQNKLIKFGTDGWRAIIASDYTVDNVKRVAEATAKWMLRKGMTQAVIGYDCRFGGKMFMDTTVSVLGHFGIKVYMAEDFVSTPMVSLGVVKTESDLGIVITASHNPPSYNGFKLKSSFGGPTLPADISEVENLIPETTLGKMPSVQDLKGRTLVEEIDLEQMYIDHIEEHFDLKSIQKANIKLAYDAMYGAGQNVVKRLFPKADFLHCEYNPSFMGQAPEPIHRNLLELSNHIKNTGNINLGLANDGDADRIGLYDENGEFVDSHHILLLLLFYLREYKSLDGKVIVTFSVTNKMKILADQYGLDFEVTKIGFKYIAEIMIKEDIICGGEESGGLAVKGHIPERDGIWIGLMIMEFMALTGKSLSELVKEVYKKVGPFKFDRDDLRLSEEQKHNVITKCKNGEITSIDGKAVKSTEIIDGYKFFLSDDEWVMVRPSGTEPVLRVYAQSVDNDSVRKLLDATHEVLQKDM